MSPAVSPAARCTARCSSRAPLAVFLVFPSFPRGGAGGEWLPAPRNMRARSCCAPASSVHPPVIFSVSLGPLRCSVWRGLLCPADVRAGSSGHRGLEHWQRPARAPWRLRRGGGPCTVDVGWCASARGASWFIDRASCPSVRQCLGHLRLPLRGQNASARENPRNPRSPGHVSVSARDRHAPSGQVDGHRPTCIACQG